jgi:hypothetical protein
VPPRGSLRMSWWILRPSRSHLFEHMRGRHLPVQFSGRISKFNIRKSTTDRQVGPQKYAMASSTNPTIINTVQIRDDDNFKRSYDQFQDYPQSLVYQTSYPWALEESKSRLTEQSARLFRSDGFEIPFRDFVDGGKLNSSSLP